MRPDHEEDGDVSLMVVDVAIDDREAGRLAIGASIWFALDANDYVWSDGIVPDLISNSTPLSWPR